MPGAINRGRGAKAEVEEGQRQEEGEIQHRIHWSKLMYQENLILRMLGLGFGLGYGQS